MSVVRLGDRMVDALDVALTVVFWLPAKIVGYKKCSKCTIRVRWAQAMLLLTHPVRRWQRADRWRVIWESRVTRGERKRVAL